MNRRQALCEHADCWYKRCAFFELNRHFYFIRLMRKRLCLLLICWLPCFVMAANVMSLQMTLAGQMLAMKASQQVEMPCHQMAGTDVVPSTVRTDVPAHHAPVKQHCTVCGFCMVSAGVAHLDTFPHVVILAQSDTAPAFMAAPVHSHTYPPAIKPPISA